jgi:hypothetical protein
MLAAALPAPITTVRPGGGGGNRGGKQTAGEAASIADWNKARNSAFGSAVMTAGLSEKDRGGWRRPESFGELTYAAGAVVHAAR